MHNVALSPLQKLESCKHYSSPVLRLPLLSLVFAQSDSGPLPTTHLHILYCLTVQEGTELWSLLFSYKGGTFAVDRNVGQEWLFLPQARSFNCSLFVRNRTLPDSSGPKNVYLDELAVYMSTASIMYYPFRQDANAKESILNSPAPNLIDSGSTARSLASSFSGQSDAAVVFRHTGNIQGLHNVQASCNTPTMPSTFLSQNSGLGGSATAVSHEPLGSLPTGQFGSNNVQVSHGAHHGCTGVISRVGGNITGSHAFGSSMNGIGASMSTASLGSAAVNQGAISGFSTGEGLRFTSSGNDTDSIFGDISRTINSGSLSNLSNLSVHMTLGSNDGMGVQGPGRPLNGMFQQVTLRNQHVNPIVHQRQEFSIQSEDFPALSGFKGGGSEFPVDLHPKDQQHENAMALLQSQHFVVRRSNGFNLGGSLVSHRQLHLQQSQRLPPPGISTSATPSLFEVGSLTDRLRMHRQASELSLGPSALYRSQAQAFRPSGAGNAQLHVPSLRSGGPSNSSSSLGSYEQMIHPYHQHLSQSQFLLGSHQQHLSPISQFSEEQERTMQGTAAGPDEFGLLGLLSVIRMSEPDLANLALGRDLTTLGLNLNSRDNLYKAFGSPWADGPIKGEPKFTLPQCYVQQATVLQPGNLAKFQQDTLFYIFYSMPNDEAQLYAAMELCNRGWFYHKELGMWLTHVPDTEPLVKKNTYERGAYFFFDPAAWESGRKDNFVLYYEIVENRPQLPQH